MEQIDEIAMGRRAIDKLIAKLAARTVGDIDQAGAAPAIVIIGDVHIGGNNTICWGAGCPKQIGSNDSASDPPPKV